MAWTKETTEMVIDLFEKGLSASVAATRINGAFGTKFTRNSVIGKWFRMGLFRAGQRPKSGPKPKQKTNLFPPVPYDGMPSRLAQRVNTLRKLHLEMQAVVAPPLPAPMPEAVEPLRVPLFELESHMCRWPIGDPRMEDFAFCGLPQVEGRSYCSQHCGRAYQKPQASMPTRGHYRKAA